MSLKQVLLTIQCSQYTIDMLGTQEIETWADAVALYDNQEFEQSLKMFDVICDTAKMLFNCGVIHATLGEHDKAVSVTENQTLGHTIDLVIGRMLSASHKKG